MAHTRIERENERYNSKLTRRKYLTKKKNKLYKRRKYQLSKRLTVTKISRETLPISKFEVLKIKVYVFV